MENPGRRAIVSYVWALSPLYTFGVATPATMLIAAARLRTSLLMWLAVPVYIALTVLWLGTEPEPGTALEGASTAAFMLSIVLGTGHALVIRRKVFPDNALEGAKAEVRRRQEQRARARDLARRHPETAVEMHIGRPDLERVYDDGGLVDLNHAPVSALTLIPGLTPEMAEGIVRVRADVGGFVSPEEVAAMAGLPPSLTPRIAEYGIFLR